MIKTASNSTENTQVQQAHWQSISIAVLTVVTILVAKRFNPKWPSALLGMIAAGLAVVVFDLTQSGVVVLSELPRTLPPFTFPDRP